MSQGNYVIDNLAGAGFRAAINQALAAIATNNSGATEPAVMYAHQWWADTSANILKRRNAGNTAWVSVMSLSLAITSYMETVLGAANAASARVLLNALSSSGGDLSGALNESRTTVASHATTADIWAALGNSINWTGTATTTTFPAASQAGAKRRLHCAGACSFVNSATLSIVGNADFVATAGAIVDVEAVTTTTFRLIPTKADGTAVVASGLRIERRQTVQRGSVDASGQANFISSGTGLSLNLAATTAPLQINFAAGDKDFSAVVNADVVAAWSSLTASSTLYCYANRDVATGAISFGFTSLIPAYGYGITKSTANGQHTFRIDEGVMYVGNGSAAVPVQRVFMGECVTGASTITSVVTYVMMRRFQSPQTSFLAAGTALSFPMNMGVPVEFLKGNLKGITQTTVDGWPAGVAVELLMNRVDAVATNPVVMLSRNNAIINAGYGFSGPSSGGGVNGAITLASYKAVVSVTCDW